MMKNGCDLQNFNYFQRQIYKVANSNNFLCHYQLVASIIELPFQQSDILTLLIQCLNNLAVSYYKFDLFSEKIFKFIKIFLLKNGQLQCNLVRNQIVRYIVQLNMAKMKCQLKQFGKAYLIVEQAMKSTEGIIFKRLRNSESKSEDAMLLINGYILLVKSYGLASDSELIQIQAKSALAQSFNDEEISKFYQNARQLAQKYLGPSHSITLKLLKSSTHRYKKPQSINQVQQQISRLELIQLNCLLKLVKNRIGRIQPEKVIYRRPIKNSQQSIDFHKSQQSSCSQIDISKPSIRKFQVKCKRNSNDRNSSNETTKELKKYETPRNPEYSQIEVLIQKEIKQQLALRHEYNQTMLETRNNQYEIDRISVEKTKTHYEKILQEQGLNLKHLEEELEKLKLQALQNEAIQQYQKNEIEELKANNQQLLLKKKSELESVKKNNFIREFQISSEQKNTFTQSAIKKSRNQINEFVVPSEQTPIKIVNSLIGVFQATENKNSIEEFQQSNKKSTPPFSFSFHKNQCNQEQVQKTPPINSQDNTFDQFWPSQKIQHISDLELEDSMMFSFIDQFSQQTISIHFVTNEIFAIDIVGDLSYNIEISIISNKENARLEDMSLLIQANINSQRITELIEVSSLVEFLQHTVNNSNLPYPLKFITTYKHFIQYLLIPFIQVAEEQSEYKIVIWPTPQGLINEQQINFCDESCEWWIHYLHTKNFKISICINKSTTLIIELQFDQASFDEYFELVNEDEYDKQELRIFLNEENKKKNNNIYKLQSLKVKNKISLIKTINESLVQIQGFLEDQKKPNLMRFISQELISLNLDIFEINKSRASLITQFEGKLYLLMKNLFTSFQPNKEQGFTKGTLEITNKLIEELYHVNLMQLSEQEKQILLKQIKNHYSLFSYNTLQEGEDMEFKNENPVVQLEQNFGGTYQKMVGDSYKTPLNFTLIGVSDRPEFIRIDNFNPETLEQRGILLFINEDFWRKEEISTSKKKGKQCKYNKEFAIQEKYHLTHFLSNSGWMILERLILSNQKILIGQDDSIFKLEQFLRIK